MVNFNMKITSSFCDTQLNIEVLFVTLCKSNKLIN